MSLQELFYPESVAVIGSMTPGKLGSVLLKQIVDGNFPGKLYAINPKAMGAFSVPGYESIMSIGKHVDLAIIASPSATVAGVLEDCGQSGVKAAVVITAGFSEAGNKDAEVEIARIAGKYGIRMVGPNCAGIVNTSAHLFPTLEIHPPAGGVALISQSGALGGVVLAWAEEQGLGISKFVSYGNGADLSQEDLLRYLSTDPETKVVAIYVESVKNGRAFIEALESCSRVKPVVVIKAGRTGVGRRATASHTGSMAGEDAVYEAAISQSGAVRVKSVEEMLDLCFGFLNLPPVDGNRVVIVTNSGGPGVLAADYGEEIGLNVAEPASEAMDILKTFLPPQCALRNPIDLTVEGTGEQYYRTFMTVLDNFDAAIGMNICPPYLDAMQHAQGVLRASQESGKPFVANFIPNQIVKDSVQFLKDNRIPNFPSGEKAMAALAKMAQYARSQKKLGERERHSVLMDRADQIPKKSLPLSPILEPAAMGWLAENGIPVPAYRFAQDEDEVLTACEEIGFPVVMKIVSPDILHKSEFGGVEVNIQNEEEALHAYRSIVSKAQRQDVRGVMVYPMITGGQEVLVGLSTDDQFGPVVAVGLGGIFTEVWRDISLRIAPIDLHTANEMIDSLKSVKMLRGVRGKPPRDVGALSELLVKFSYLPFQYPEISEIDLNPVFVFETGLVAGDVRIIKRP